LDLVSIVIPTLYRPASLRRALASARAQNGAPDFAIEIIVVDNSPEGLEALTHAEIAKELSGRDNSPSGSLPGGAGGGALAAPSQSECGDPRRAGPLAVKNGEGAAGARWVHEPRAGVSNARNAGVKAARGRWVAFLDDDEEASPGWIAALVEVARRTGADAVFGPVEGRAERPHAIGGFAPYFSRRLKAPDGADITRRAAYLGANNSMFDRARCLYGETPFDVRLNQTGGEDSLLLRCLELAGRRFAWAAGAEVVEWAPPRRLTWAYQRKRKFLSGQIRVFVRLMAAPRRWDLVALWMTVGLAQGVVAGVASSLTRPFSRETAAGFAVTACGGLGKIFWQRPFRPALYGACRQISSNPASVSRIEPYSSVIHPRDTA
jgi:glycosyltransferase involved in cell wall biosynthesis